jgi:hypothetical protein
VGAQLEHNLERLRVAVDDLLVKLSRQFPRPKQQVIFLINNYDVVLQVLKVSRTLQAAPAPNASSGSGAWCENDVQPRAAPGDAWGEPWSCLCSVVSNAEHVGRSCLPRCSCCGVQLMRGVGGDQKLGSLAGRASHLARCSVSLSGG